MRPAAFGRLRVETGNGCGHDDKTAQPPSGGCVLKHIGYLLGTVFVIQPPSGGCVLKHIGYLLGTVFVIQPPSGGCVLKPQSYHPPQRTQYPAAFGRLRVETCPVVCPLSD